MAITELSGCKIAYDDVGQGEPALLFMPGWCAPRWAFEPLVPLVAKHHRTLTLDWRGHGESGPAPGDFGQDELVDDAVSVLDAAKVKSVVAVALAHAGWVAIDLRKRLAERIRGIVLIEWFVLGAPPPFREALEDLQSPQRWRPTVDAIFERWLHGSENPDLVRFVREGMGAADFSMWARGGREIAAAFDRHPVPLEVLGGLDIPVLHLYATPPDQSYLDAQQGFARNHPWFSVNRLTAQSHFPMFEAPEEMAEAILSFTGSL